MTFEKEPVEIRRRPRLAPRLALFLAVAAGLAVAVGVAVWRAQAGARAEHAARLEAAAQWQAEVENARRRLAGESAVENRMRLVETLLRAERALAELEPGGLAARLPEIARLEGELDRLLASAKLALSRQRENEAAEALAAGDRTGAERLLREAWELQRDVNRAAADAGRDREREARLEREFNRLVAEPLQAEVAAGIARAEAALAAQQWDEALTHFRAARRAQDRLNREFARTRYSDIALLGRLDNEIAALDADGLQAQVTAAWEEGRRHAAAGREAEAAAAFAAAAQAQRALNERFSRTRFVSMERLEQIDTERQTVLAAAPWRAAAEAEARARGHLRRREVFQAEQALRAAAGRIAEVAAQWPKARGGDEALQLRVRFLTTRASELAALQDRFYDALRPLPGRSGLALLRAAVRQEEFAAIMSQNPSRRTGAAAPVDSVSAEEAAEFCARLTWLLGRTVRLPSAAELESAAADDSGEWGDLRGSFQEWVAGVETPAGAAWRDAATGAVQVAPPTARSRERGFRVVVEVDLAHPEAD